MAGQVQTTRRTLTLCAIAWIVAAIAYVLLEWAAASVMPKYSYTEHYISALGVPEWSPRAHLMNTAFYVQGVLFLVGAVIAVRAVRGRWTGGLFLLLATANTAGNILVGVVHGGSPLWDDGHKWLHMLGAILAIFGGNAAAVVGSIVVARAVAARWYKPVGILIGVAGLAIFASLQSYNDWGLGHVPIGLIERACVYTIMVWQVFTGIVLLTRPALSRA